jgi:hypothetical protein
MPPASAPAPLAVGEIELRLHRLQEPLLDQARTEGLGAGEAPLIFL